MLRNCVIAVALALSAWASSTIRAQTPEITVTAASADALLKVLDGFGDRGEMFGFTGPQAFLKSYGRFLDNQQPVTAALTFTTKTPMFAAEFATKDLNAFLDALKQDDIQLDAKTGELTKVGSSLRFFTKLDGNTFKVSDNAEFLKNVRWPASEKLSASNLAAVARVDWRNLKPELRTTLAEQTMMVFLPQANSFSPIALDALPELLSTTAAGRIAALFSQSESMTFQFTLDQSGSLQVTADVLNRALIGRPTVESPFTSIDSANTLASLQWNTPIESDLRTLTQAWAAQLTTASKQLFAGDEIADTSGMKVLNEGAAFLARHVIETIALPNLQGGVQVLADNDHPIILAGIRVANRLVWMANCKS